MPRAGRTEAGKLSASTSESFHGDGQCWLLPVSVRADVGGQPGEYQPDDVEQFGRGSEGRASSGLRGLPGTASGPQRCDGRCRDFGTCGLPPSCDACMRTELQYSGANSRRGAPMARDDLPELEIPATATRVFSGTSTSIRCR